MASRYDAMLRVVIESLGTETGEALFERLTESLGVALGADTCFIAALTSLRGQAACQTRATWRRDGVRESLCWPLAGSPSHRVLDSGMLVVPRDAAGMFPDDDRFVAERITAYAGVAIRDAAGAAVGVLGAMAREPFRDIESAPKLLEVFSRRLSVEFQRMDSEAALRAANEALRRARDEHAVAERRIRDIAELSSDWFWETDAEHRFVYISETVAGVSDVVAEGYRGKTRRELLGPLIDADCAGVLDRFEALHASRLPYRDVAYAVRSPDGRRCWVSISGRPVFDAAGAFVGYRGAGADITPLREAQEEADRAARLLSEGVGAMTSGFALFDDRQRLIVCNDLYGALCGLPEGERLAPGMCYADILRDAVRAGVFAGRPDDLDGFVARRRAAHAAADGRPTEAALANGRWLEITDRRTPSGGVVSVRADITARKHAEMRLLDAIEHIPVGFIMCDPDDNFLMCNRRYRDLYPELEPRLRRGVPFVEICELCGDLVDADGKALPFDVWLRQRLERHRNPTGPVQTATQSGKTVMVWESRTAEGGYVGAHVDISALVLLQHELARETQRAEAALEARSRFLANMSHELRTPLNAILGFAEMIRMRAAGPLPDRYVEFAEMIRQSGQFLLSLIVDILDMSKIEAGQMPVSRTAVDPRPAIEEAMAMLALPARNKGLALSLDAQPALPPVWAERRRLVQIVQNLVSNAVKFTAAGGVTVRAFVEGDAFRLEVADTGVGMGADEIRVALTPFQQVRRGDESDALDGTGLGLPLVKALVELHGGTLRIDSARGAGTTVRVGLPLATGGSGD
jgi:PAS domain S-box-containing protein